MRERERWITGDGRPCGATEPETRSRRKFVLLLLLPLVLVSGRSVGQDAGDHHAAAAREQRARAGERERQTEQGSRSRLAAHVSSVSCRRRRSSPPLLLSNSSSLIGGRRLSPSLAPSLSHSCFARKPVPCLGFRHTCSLRTASALDTITESAADKRDTRSSQQEPGRGPRDDRGSVYGPLDGGRRQDSRRREAHLWSSSSSRVDDK